MTNKTNKTIAFLLFFFAGMTIGNNELNAQVSFYNGSLIDLQLAAHDQDKYYILFFEADWCEPCKRMQKEVFTDIKVGNLVDKKFLLKKVNGEVEPYIHVVQDMFVDSYPTTIIFDKEGSEVRRLSGYYDKDNFTEELKTFVPNSRKTYYSEYR